MRINGSMSEVPVATSFSRRKALVLAALGGIAVSGYLWGMRDWRREHDRHLVRAELVRLEGAIRGAHVYQDWLYVESGAEGSEEEARHPEHLALLDALDRLAHVDGFAFKEIQISLAGDLAQVTSGVAGRSQAGRPAPPHWLEMAFERRRGRWILARIATHEASPRPPVSAPGQPE